MSGCGKRKEKNQMDLSKLGLTLHHTCNVVPDLDQARRLYKAMGYYAYRQVEGEDWESIFVFEPNTRDIRQLIAGEDCQPHDAYYGPDLPLSKVQLIRLARKCGYTVTEEELPGGKWQISIAELPFWIELTSEPKLTTPPEPLEDEVDVAEPDAFDEHFGIP